MKTFLINLNNFDDKLPVHKYGEDNEITSTHKKNKINNLLFAISTHKRCSHSSCDELVSWPLKTLTATGECPHTPLKTVASPPESSSSPTITSISSALCWKNPTSQNLQTTSKWIKSVLDSTVMQEYGIFCQSPAQWGSYGKDNWLQFSVSIIFPQQLN